MGAAVGDRAVSAFEGEEDFAAESAAVHPVWQVGDRVRRVAGPEILLGSVGTVVQVDVPGKWPIRVAVDARIGFGKVLCAAWELAPEHDMADGGTT
jgi:hypothetical protein